MRERLLRREEGLRDWGVGGRGIGGEVIGGGIREVGWRFEEAFYRKIWGEISFFDLVVGFVFVESFEWKVSIEETFGEVFWLIYFILNDELSFSK